MTTSTSYFLRNILWTYDYINELFFYITFCGHMTTSTWHFVGRWLQHQQTLSMSFFLHYILWTDGYIIDTLMMSSFYITFCGQMATLSAHPAWALFTLHSVGRWLQYWHTNDELFLHYIPWQDEVRLMHECVFNIHKSHFWVWDSLHAICSCGYQVCKSLSTSAFRFLLPDGLTAQWHLIFLKLFC
jgi:hypothetical protein